MAGTFSEACDGNPRFDDQNIPRYNKPVNILFAVAKHFYFCQYAAMDIQIERGIPIPEVFRTEGAGRPPMYPFATMAVGESFVARKKARSAASEHKRRTPGWNYIARSLGDGRLRIWRTA